MLQYEGKRVRGPNGEEGVIQNGQIVLVPPSAPAQPPGLRLLQPAPAKEPAPVRPIVEATDRQQLENAELTPGNMRFQNEGELRQNFEKMLPVQSYRTVVQPYVAAIRAADNQAGDLDIVYAFGKIMDPGSVVREGEMDMVTGTGAVAERVKGYLASLRGAGRLTPQIRADLLREIRSRASAAGEAYNQARQQYKGLASRYGFDPDAIVGPHVGLPFQQEEANYLGRPVRNQDGSEGPAPAVNRAEMEAKFADEPQAPADPWMEDWRTRNAQAEQTFEAAYLKGASEEQLWTLSQRVFGPNADSKWRDFIRKAVRDREAGRPHTFVPGPISAPVQDISDARGGNEPALPPSPFGMIGEGIQFFASERGDAAIRGTADVGTLGLADEIAAAGDTITGGGTYAENLYRQRGIDRYDEQNNAAARIGGQLAGSFALPVGRIKTVGDLTRVGAAYGGAYGFGSGEGDLADRGRNALLGAGAGAATSFGLGKAIPTVGQGINALGRRVMGDAPPEAANVLAAAERQQVPLNVADVRPGSRNAFAFLESMPGSAGPLQRNVAAGRDAMAERAGELGSTGTALEENVAGQRIRDAGERSIQELGTRARRLYGRAEKLSGNPTISAQGAVTALDGHIAELSQTANANKGLLSLLTGLKEDLSKPLTIGALRNIRTAMRGEIGTRNLTASNADRIVNEVLEAASQDIAAGLSGNPAALRAYQQADKFYRDKQVYIKDVLQRFLGPKDAPLAAEKTLAALKSMASPKGDSRRMAEMMRALEPEERADIAATFAAQLGRKSDDEPFSPALFLSSVRQISQPARRILFGDDGAKAIDDLVTLANAKKGTVERLNNSRSGQVGNYRALLSSLLFGGGAGGAGISVIAGGSGAIGAGAGTVLMGAGVGAGVSVNRALAKAFTNPAFVRALASAPATTSPKAIDAHIGRLRQLGAKDPNVRSVVESLERALLASANDNARLGAAAASGEPGQKKE